MGNYIHKRINKIIENNGLNINSFSKKIGVAATTLNSMFTKGTNPSFELLNKIINVFTDISTEWLITGKGEMLKDNSEPKEKKSIILADNKEVIQLQKEKADLEKLSSKKDKEIEFLRANIDKLVDLVNKQTDQINKLTDPLNKK